MKYIIVLKAKDNSVGYLRDTLFTWMSYFSTTKRKSLAKRYDNKEEALTTKKWLFDSCVGSEYTATIEEVLN